MIGGGHATAVLNAWKSDHAGDATVAVMDSMLKTFDELGTKQQGLQHIIEETKGKIKKYGKLLLKVSGIFVGGAVKKLTGTPVAEIAEVVKEGISTGADAGDLASEKELDLFVMYRLRSETLNEIKDSLNKLAKDEYFKTNGKRFVILVDELDRCRPTYAIELLEAVKHFFSAPNVVFVLGVCKPQLEHSIKAVYGSTFDAGLYLQRFFHLTYELPPLAEQQIDAFVKAEKKKYRLDEKLDELNTKFLAGVTKFLEREEELMRLLLKDITALRPIQRFLFTLTIAINSKELNEINRDWENHQKYLQHYFLFLVYLSYCKVFEEKLYQEIKSYAFTYDPGLTREVSSFTPLRISDKLYRPNKEAANKEAEWRATINFCLAPIKIKVGRSSDNSDGYEDRLDICRRLIGSDSGGSALYSKLFQKNSVFQKEDETNYLSLAIEAIDFAAQFKSAGVSQ